MAQYSLNSFTRSRALEESIAYINQTSREQLAQQFINAYMTPGPFADAVHRLGRPIAIEENESEVPTTGFPPYDDADLKYITHAGLPFRLGGFKSVNDRINVFQGLLRKIYGEIRTKITEWDISIYLQELYMDPTIHADLSDLSLLYRMKEDNPGRYKDHRAYTYGILNTAVSFDRWKRWDPRFDPELRHWQPPTSALETWALPPVPQQRTIAVTKPVKTKWWQRNRTKTVQKTVWYIPARPTLTREQQREVNHALEAKWTNWFPPYWQLFFWNDDLSSLGADDEEAAREKHLSSRETKWSSDSAASGGRFSLRRLLRLKRNRQHVTTQTSKAAAKVASGKQGILTKTVRESGINVKSPILTGRPIGRFKDPTSLIGYLANERVSQDRPKLAPTANPSHPINLSNRGINQHEGIRRVLDGWTTSFLARRERQVLVRVWVPVTSGASVEGGRVVQERTVRVTRTDQNGNPYTDIRVERGYYQQELQSQPYRERITRYGQFPNLTGTLRYEKERQSKQRRLRSFLGFRFFASRSSFIPGKFLIVGEAATHTNFLTRFEDETDKVPVIFMTRDNATVITGTLQRDTYTTPEKYYERRWRLLRRWRYFGPLWREVPHPCLTLHAGSITQFTTYSQETTQLSPSTIEDLVGDSAISLQGFFFNIPARMLDDSDNIITSKWNVSAFGNKGPALARALTSCVWSRPNGQVVTEGLLSTLSSLQRLFKEVETYTHSLTIVSSSFNLNLLQALIYELPEDRQITSHIRRAHSRFTEHRLYQFRQQVDNVNQAFIESTTLLEEMLVKDGNGVLIEAELTRKRLLDFLEDYRKISSFLQDTFLYDMIVSYLDVMYEWRLVYLKQRLNKVDGTLMQVARVEAIDVPTAEGVGVPPSIADTIVDEILPVAHTTTNISLATRAKAIQSGESLPTERIRFLYVPVQYRKDGSIVRPAAGDYDLLSKEYVENAHRISRVRFYISFEGNQAPPIVQNVMTGVDPTELQNIVNNPYLSTMEKICAARDTQDWWKIEVPSAIRPLRENFVTDLALMMIPSASRIDNLLTLLGTTQHSPVLEHSAQEASMSLASLNSLVQEVNRTALGNL